MEETVRVLSMFLEGLSICSCERRAGFHRDKILGLMIDAGEACIMFMDRVNRKVPATCLESEEHWQFIDMEGRTAEL